MTTLREAAAAVMEQLKHGWVEESDPVAQDLKAALAEPEQTEKKNIVPITDDNGKPLRPQYRIIEQIGNWFLLYDQLQRGETVRHEFRIQKLRHDIALYPGITLVEAQKRFRERVETDNE